MDYNNCQHIFIITYHIYGGIMFLRDLKISNIGKNLKDYRISQGKTQKDMADLLEIGYQNYSTMERGLYQPSLKKLLEICDILHLTPNDLLLEGREFDDFKKERLERMDNNIIDMIDTMHIIEEQRAAAAVAHSLLDYDTELFHLNTIYNIVNTNYEAEPNQNFKTMVDALYYNYINNWIKKFSNTAFKELYDKKFQEELDKK